MDKRKEVQEAEKYSEYLRQQMGDRLTSAVAEVIEKRPSDPINHLAEYLYDSMNMRPPSSQILRNRRQNMQQWTPDYNSHGMDSVSTQNQQSRTVDTGNRIWSSDEGFIDYGHDMSTDRLHSRRQTRDSENYTDSGEYEIVRSTNSEKIQDNIHVHSSIMGLLLEIGDLFNDEDVT